MEFSELLGKTLVSVEVSELKDEILFVTSDGDRFMQYHSQDCCEGVAVEEVVGDFGDLLGEPILMAEEVVHVGETPEGVPTPEYSDESFTWTFYKVATIKGAVTIRWYGSSNGYYSESVEMRKLRA